MVQKITIPDPILYDKRLIERHIAKGFITRAEVNKRAEAAEDLVDQADYTSFQELIEGPADKSATPGETPKA
ncbi:MAG: hypothetical protein A2289_18195 [Deltaproteobacteria bacterium RIFOXYA12_FULL_58_15]|nr:MAG: hypothetical protein A2289_18195 [Deltaproteobacteria bacterium RIFOXYA12_FULL_58_15]OGR11060.1 MAG: hypothetical protein A2341_12030 [Deltaproteobacteria bacterium RIFOXYB12_FULL_58_9]